MQFKKKIFGIFLSICLMLSCICLEQYETDAVTSSFAASTVMTSGGISNHDACTIEMLGNHSSGLVYREASSHIYLLAGKSKTVFFLPRINGSDGLISLSHFLQNSYAYPVNTDIFETIHYIHNKDGKK